MNEEIQVCTYCDTKFSIGGLECDCGAIYCTADCAKHGGFQYTTDERWVIWICNMCKE